MVASSPVTTSKWVWWAFLVVSPLLAILLLTIGSPALPVGLIVTAIPVYVTWRLLGRQWRTWKIVRLLYTLLVASAVMLAIDDPAMATAMYVPEWLSSVVGFYFMAAPLFLAACVLVELHRVVLFDNPSGG
jgi:hypothetical protein